LRDQRAEIGRRVDRSADLQAFDARDELFHQPIGGGLADRHRDRDRHAALAGRAVAGADQRVDGLVHVRVRHDDGVVLGAAEALRALAGRRRALVDVLRDRGRADEADGLDVGIVEDRVDRFLVAVDDVQDMPGGRPASIISSASIIGTPGSRSDGFRMKALPQAIAGANFHIGIIAGKVERRDSGDDAERLAHRIDVDAGAGALRCIRLS
jgi:hypothetical protein